MFVEEKERIGLHTLFPEKSNSRKGWEKFNYQSTGDKRTQQKACGLLFLIPYSELGPVPGQIHIKIS